MFWVKTHVTANTARDDQRNMKKAANARQVKDADDESKFPVELTLVGFKCGLEGCTFGGRAGRIQDGCHP